MVVDLSELLDLHEDGFAVQTSEPLEVDRAVTLCLDLPETKSLIHGSGHVIWSDAAGRGGIRLSGLPESSRRKLKEWLFANLLIACSNHVARTEQLARHEAEKSPGPVPVHESVTHESQNVLPISDGSGMLSALEAVRSEVDKIADDVDAVLQLIADRALGLTGASGAALAFLTDDQMICRARTGGPAPPLGAPVDVKQGLSGECVRSRLLVSCEDLQNDPRVDPEIGHGLGVGSLMAAPIVSGSGVLGLLEVFSPQSHAFTKAHATVLSRLVEMVPHRGKTQEMGSLESGSTHGAREVLLEQESDPPEQVSQQVPEPIAAERVPDSGFRAASTIPSRLLPLALLGMAIAVVAMVAGYLTAPIIEKRWAPSAHVSQRSATETVSGQSATNHGSPEQRPRVNSLADLQKLAAQGDADAQWQMGVRYHNGEGVPHDDAQAMQWFLRAAEQGNVAAQGALGAYYWAGRGVPVDMSQAYFWSTIALAHGDENSKIRLEGLASQMTQAQVAAARQQAEAWIHQHNSAKPQDN